MTFDRDLVEVCKVGASCLVCLEKRSAKFVILGSQDKRASSSSSVNKSLMVLPVREVGGFDITSRVNASLSLVSSSSLFVEVVPF